jgi:hypothetical protein
MTITATQADPTRPPVTLAVTGLPVATVLTDSVIEKGSATGNYVSTPDTAALDITGDIDLRIDVTLTDWNPGSFRTLIAKYTPANQKSYGLGINNSGKVAMFWSSTGSNDLESDSTVNPTPAASGRLAVRAVLDVNNGAAGNTVTFYTAPTIAGPWTQLGAPVVTGGTTSIFSSTAIVELGSDSGGVSFHAATIHSAEIINSAGAIVAAPSARRVSAGSTSFTDSTGKVWTLNGAGTSVVAASTTTLDGPSGIVQRSTDGVRWATVRGAIDAEIDSAGELTDIADYEFRPGVVNDYRGGTIQAIVDTFTRTVASALGTADTGQTYDGSGSPFSVGSGRASFLHAAADSSNTAHVSSPVDAGDVDLTCTWDTNAVAGGIAGGGAVVGWHLRDDLVVTRYTASVRLNADQTMEMEVISTVEGVDFTVIDGVALPNLYVGAVDGAIFRTRVKITGQRIRMVTWEPELTPQPDWQIDETVEAAARLGGGSVGLATDRLTGNTNTNLTFRFYDFVVDTGNPTYLAALDESITPDLAGFWLTSTMRSFLNLAPRVVDFGEPSRVARGGSNYVAGRTLPIGQVELSGAREWPLTIRVPTLAAARNLEYVIASGDVFYLQTPADCPIPRGYYRIGDMAARRAIPRGGAVRLFELPLVECAAPGPDVATASATWASVIALYGTWPDVVAAQATWEDLLEIIGDPSEVIVE